MSTLKEQRDIYDSWANKKPKTAVQSLKDKIAYCLDNSDWSKKEQRDNIKGLVTKGTILECPVCTECNTIFHLEWVAISCGRCKNMINKEHFKQIV